MGWIAAGMTALAAVGWLMAWAKWRSERDWRKRYSDKWFECVELTNERNKALFDLRLLKR